MKAVAPVLLGNRKNITFILTRGEAFRRLRALGKRSLAFKLKSFVFLR